MEPRIIKSEEDYETALAEVERLIALDPEPGTPEADRLELFSTLVEAYETEKFPFEQPDAVEAILFRMEEQGLRQKDLVPFIGSRSRVSEVLARKRPLTVQMIRALSEGFGIPTQVLVGKTKNDLTSSEEIEWEKFPLREMVKKGWISATTEEIQKNPKRVVERFLKPLSGTKPAFALLRRSFHQRSAANMDQTALQAWLARVLMESEKKPPSMTYLSPKKPLDFCREVARLSQFRRGPILAQEFLSNNGVSLIIAPHLSRTFLDGAAMLHPEGWAVIGMTIRFDRIDNFWHTLLHEISHLCLHVSNEFDTFFDDMEIETGIGFTEKEADRLARNALIPRGIWQRSDAFLKRTSEAIEELSQILRINPGIIAGRIRKESANYQILQEYVGQGEIRKLFLDNF